MWFHWKAKFTLHILYLIPLILISKPKPYVICVMPCFSHSPASINCINVSLQSQNRPTLLSSFPPEICFMSMRWRRIRPSLLFLRLTRLASIQCQTWLLQDGDPLLSTTFSSIPKHKGMLPWAHIWFLARYLLNAFLLNARCLYVFLHNTTGGCVGYSEICRLFMSAIAMLKVKRRGTEIHTTWYFPELMCCLTLTLISECTV